MERVLHGIPNTIVYIDDILVTGASVKEHLGTLEEVLSQLEKSGMRLKRVQMCFFGAFSRILRVSFQLRVYSLQKTRRELSWRHQSHRMSRS